MKEIKTAKEAAIALIKPSFERGDDMDYFRHSYYGCFADDFKASIGGSVNGKHYDSKYIIVFEINNEEVNEVFKYQDIINCLKNTEVQTSLF